MNQAPIISQVPELITLIHGVWKRSPTLYLWQGLGEDILGTGWREKVSSVINLGVAKGYLDEGVMASTLLQYFKPT